MKISKILPVAAALLMLAWPLTTRTQTGEDTATKNAEQARSNIGAAALSSFSPDTMARIRSIYETSIKPSVHQRW